MGGFKVKLVSQDKLRSNRQQEDLSHGIGSFLNSIGQSMAQGREQRASMDAGAQLNEALGTNVPANVYGQIDPRAVLAMLAQNRMGQQQTAATNARYTEVEGIRQRASLEEQKLKNIAKQTEDQGKPKITVPENMRQLYGGAETLPLDAVPADVQKAWAGVGGRGGADVPWDWRKSSLTEGDMRQLNDRGYTPSILGTMTEAQRGEVTSKVFNRGQPKVPPSGTARLNAHALRESAWRIDNELYGPVNDDGEFDPDLSIDSKIIEAQYNGKDDLANDLIEKRDALIARKKQLHDAAGKYEDSLISGAGQMEPVSIDNILSELGIDDEE